MISNIYAISVSRNDMRLDNFMFSPNDPVFHRLLFLISDIGRRSFPRGITPLKLGNTPWEHRPPWESRPSREPRSSRERGTPPFTSPVIGKNAWTFCLSNFPLWWYMSSFECLNSIINHIRFYSSWATTSHLRPPWEAVLLEGFHSIFKAL